MVPIRGLRLLTFFVPDAALIRGRRLIEGGAYSSKYNVTILHVKKIHGTQWSICKSSLVKTNI